MKYKTRLLVPTDWPSLGSSENKQMIYECKTKIILNAVMDMIGMEEIGTYKKKTTNIKFFLGSVIDKDNCCRI